MRRKSRKRSGSWIRCRARADGSQALKHIGIAAITAEGAAIVYRRICKNAAQRFGDYRHPEISLHTFSLSEHVSAGADRRTKWGALVRASAEKLRAAGAELMICPSNTPHAIYDDVASSLPLPWLHIAQPVRRMAEAARATSLLLLGTKFTVESDFYDREFNGSDIALVRPHPEQTARIHDIIHAELIWGVVTPQSRQYFAHVLAEHAAAGVDGAILGCTELPLIVDETVTRMALFDSAALLADAAIEQACSP